MGIIPGGIFDPGEKISTTLKREFFEKKTLNNRRGR